MLKVRKLKVGDTIGVISPASPSPKEDVIKLEKELKSLGFKVKMGRSPFEKDKYLAGSDDLRARDINEMFLDKEVDGILCVRGGYGSPRILNLLDYEGIRKNPKVFIGFSDITALHIAFNQISGMVTFHGPMGGVNIKDGLDDFSRSSLMDLVFSGKEELVLKNPREEKLKVINPGIGEGYLTGGNLSLISDTMGTEYEIDTKGKILFIEEVSEEPRNIDRMLNQLSLAGKLHQANGIVLGDFNDCESKNPANSFSLSQVLDHYFKGLDIPVVYNFQSGHCQPMITLPLGVKTRLDTRKESLTVLELACI